MLPDGIYDGVVVDASGDAGDDDAAVRLSIAIAGGEHKGAVVDVRARHLAGDALDLLGMPCTITVTDGQPIVAVD